MAEQSEAQIERFSPGAHDVVLARHAMRTVVMDVRQHRRPLSLAVWTTATLLLALGVPGAAGFFDVFDEAMQVAFVPLLLAAAIAQVVRYRRGTPTVRLQIRWLLVTVSTVLAGFLAVAAAFGPVRRRARRMVDLVILADELCGVVARTVRPAHVGVWSPEAGDG
jgi:hypothetical protein